MAPRCGAGIRGEVLAEIKEMVAEWAAETEAWMAQRPAPVRSTYATADKDRPTQIPGPPRAPRRGGVPRYRRDHGGPHRWVSTCLARCGAAPAGRTGRTAVIRTRRRWTQLAATNWEYVRRRASGARPGEHWETLLQELVAEVKLGRVVGPTAPPAGWNIVTVPVLKRPRRRQAGDTAPRPAFCGGVPSQSCRRMAKAT